MIHDPSRSELQRIGLSSASPLAGPAAEGRISGRANIPGAFPVLLWTSLFWILIIGGGFLSAAKHPALGALVSMLGGGAMFMAVTRVGAISKARGLS